MGAMGSIGDDWRLGRSEAWEGVVEVGDDDSLGQVVHCELHVLTAGARL